MAKNKLNYEVFFDEVKVIGEKEGKGKRQLEHPTMRFNVYIQLRDQYESLVGQLFIGGFRLKGGMILLPAFSAQFAYPVCYPDSNCARAILDAVKSSLGVFEDVATKVLHPPEEEQTPAQQANQGIRRVSSYVDPSHLPVVSPEPPSPPKKPRVTIKLRPDQTILEALTISCQRYSQMFPNISIESDFLKI